MAGDTHAQPSTGMAGLLGVRLRVASDVSVALATTSSDATPEEMRLQG
ncbi:hypothetical protein [Lapillicoccus sp.]|nr:hypothetical protein [Actinomycetota bacterium]